MDGLEGRGHAGAGRERHHGVRRARMSETTTDLPSTAAEDEVPTVEDAPSLEDLTVPSIEDLEEAMRDVVDPELGINVVDLGLVYGITVDDGDAEAGKTAVLDMTLTS